MLDHALREFAEKIDPFKAEWGLPSLLKLKGPFSLGISAVAKSIEAVRQDSTSASSPRKRRFLAVFARKSLEMVPVVIKRNDQPESSRAQRLFAWLLEQPVTELMNTASGDDRANGAVRTSHRPPRLANGSTSAGAARRSSRALAHASQSWRKPSPFYVARSPSTQSRWSMLAWPLRRSRSIRRRPSLLSRAPVGVRRQRSS